MVVKVYAEVLVAHAEAGGDKRAGRTEASGKWAASDQAPACIQQRVLWAPPHLPSSSPPEICSSPHLRTHDASDSVSRLQEPPRRSLTPFRYRKPKNARSKRALQAREPKEVEDPRTAIFVKGTHAGERVNEVMKELVSLLSFYDPPAR